MSDTRYGAYEQDWDILANVCGLTADLLPVVSNPHATISPLSKMAALGKTPSVYTHQRQVVGISDWSQSTSIAADIANWRLEPDYGICLQTRTVRALDLDITDAAEVAEIEAFVRAVLGADVPLAVRRRPNSHKCLIAFEVTGIPDDEDLYKRTVKTAHGMIEYLATGQQFIVSGTHPSGSRYFWENFGVFPSIPMHTADSLWLRLCKRFGIGEPTSAAARKRGAVLAGVTDRIISQLEDAGVVRGWGKDGQAHIACPFADEHSSDTGLTATSYFPAGSGGYAQGHFICLHAHCAERTDQEFMAKLGVHEVAPAALVEMVANDPEGYEEPPMPRLKRGDNGRVEPTVGNIEAALGAPHACGVHIAKDTFLEDVMLRVWSPYKARQGSWRRLEDEDYMALRIHLENELNFAPVGTEAVRACVHLVARKNKFDSAQQWAESLVWDGIPRVGRFFTDYIKCSNRPDYAVACAQYVWSALAARALVPGIKADMMVMLISPQGIMKTSAIEALAPSPELFVEFSLAANEAERVRLIKGKLVGEVGEVRGLWGAQIEDVKAFITKRHDEWIPKYKEQSTVYPRRCIFFGTGNHYDILGDSTGSRRFLPLSVVEVDIEAIRRDCKQLWAEGVALYKLHGVMWRDAQGLAKVNSTEYTSVDPWVDVVREWLARKDEDGRGYLERHGAVSTAEVLVLALGHNKSQINPGIAKRVQEVMRALGCVRGAQGGWVRPLLESQTPVGEGG